MTPPGEGTPGQSKVVGSQGRGALVRTCVVAFLTGATVMTLLHESSHAVAGALLGYRPVQFPFAVDYVPDPTGSQGAWIAFVGPLFSLSTGLLLLAVDRAARPWSARPYWRLVWLWTIFASIQEGFGYFLIAGIATAGDTAQAFSGWRLPTSVFVASTAIGVVGQIVTAWLFSTPVSELSGSLGDKRVVAVWTWLYGTVAFVVLTGCYVLLSPGVGAAAIVAVIAGSVAVGVYAPMSMMFRPARSLASQPLRLAPNAVAAYGLLGALIAINLVLTQGWLWG